MRSVHRTARIRLRLTRAQTRRCYSLLRSAGDVWAGLIELNDARSRRGLRPVANFQALCREITGAPLGELGRTCAEGVAKRYSDAFFEAVHRRQRGERAGFPRRKKLLFPVRFRFGTFALPGVRVRLSTARGYPPLYVRLARPVPYPPDSIRSVTLLVEAGRVFLDVTARLPVEDHDLDPARVAGVDLGIIHPYAVAAGSEACLVSGRQLRAEERLHLADGKARARAMASKRTRSSGPVSRRLRKLRGEQLRANARHRRRIHQAHHQAAKAILAWAIARGIGTLVVGDPAGVTTRNAGRHHNWRLRAWRRTHLVRALVDKAAVAGVRVVRVDERRTSSTCPECNQQVPKPRGRNFSCPHCGHRGHRDLIAARNIAARGGGITSSPLLVTHRRAGKPPARRDRRRHRMDARRSCPAPGRPARLGVARRRASRKQSLQGSLGRSSRQPTRTNTRQSSNKRVLEEH